MENLKHYKPVKNLLSKGSTNAKTSKNDIKTFILYLAPHNLNYKGISLCKDASINCIKVCLNSAGRGAFSNVQLSRINKANFYVSDKKVFLTQLCKEIKKEIAKAIKNEEKIAFRLNGTSDIDFIYLLKKHCSFDIENLNNENIFFYDYTKSVARAIRYKDSKIYTLTFSKSESNNKDCDKIREHRSINIAAVFLNELPNKYKNIKVVDGDKSDLIMLKHKGVILGLKAKGKARKDKSGFVITNY